MEGGGVIGAGLGSLLGWAVGGSVAEAIGGVIGGTIAIGAIGHSELWFSSPSFGELSVQVEFC